MNNIIDTITDNSTMVIGVTAILTTALAAWALARRNYKQYIIN